jgi:hypothetical protein
VIRDDYGNGGFSLSQARNMAKQAHGVFAPHGIYLDFEFEELSRNIYLSPANAEALDLAFQYLFTTDEDLLDPNRINVFLAEVEDNASDIYEQAALAFGIPNNVSYIRRTAADINGQNLLAHELGHNLGLHHTFKGNPYDLSSAVLSCAEDDPAYINQEYVQSENSNCNSCGDCVCGTLQDAFRYA